MKAMSGINDLMADAKERKCVRPPFAVNISWLVM